MTGYTFLAAELARLAYLDGKDEGLNACLGIAFSIKNRIRAGWHNGDWAAVLSNHHQWSATLETPSLVVPDPRVFSFSVLLQEVEGIFNGSRRDDITIAKESIFNTPLLDLKLGGGPAPALYWGRLDKANNPWWIENIARRTDIHPRVASVGLISFFS